MPVVISELSDLETKAAAGEPFTRADAERMLACRDLVSIGAVGEAARKSRSGDRVAYGRVCVVSNGEAPEARGDAGEVRVVGAPASAEQACAWTATAAAIAGDAPVTGFSAVDLLNLAKNDHLKLAALARRLRAAGLDAVAEAPLDRLGPIEDLVEVVRAIRHGGLAVRRVTVDHADLGARLDLIERAADLQRLAGGIQAFAPLPRHDAAGVPSTGYDDVRMVAIARARCREIPFLQVDWPLYGPKLAQVAIAYGADDIDGIDARDGAEQGRRRAPREDIMRQIRAAAAEPAERNGRYEWRT